MNILVTGAGGFIGKNLVQWLKQSRPDDTLMLCDVDNAADLENFCLNADFVFHLAGVNRPENPADFERGNAGLTEMVFEYCRKGKKPPVLLTSSAQASLDNPYGISKKAAEDAAHKYTKETGSKTHIYRLPGVFGKWCRPNYNSVVATFCHNIAHGIPIQINDPSAELQLVYIDDVCNAFINTLNNGDFCEVKPIHSITLGGLADTLNSFYQSRHNLHVADMSSPLIYKLYSTYLSYLPNFAYDLKSHADNRGSFTEFLKTQSHGQISINITKPGITKGNQWHHSKNEKFLVVSGQGLINLRKLGETEIIQHPVNDTILTVVDIPPGYIHNITNTGQIDLVTIMWANEPFNPEKPDTFFEEV